MNSTAYTDDNPLADSRVRLLIGLSGASVILVVAFLSISDPTFRWLLVGIACLDAVVTPHLLKRAVEETDT